MVVRSSAAPPTPWSKDLSKPTIDTTAYVHSFSNIIGDVRIGANVMIAPGTSIRADEGAPFHIGDSTNVQDGVVIHGLEKGRVLGDDDNPYSVWIGSHTSITHMALVHGPAYVGDNCFIGFRSTVFNARVGRGCIIMMHALIQDVEIPPGKYVPSGAVITSQQQADRLSDVQDADIQFASHVVGINSALRSGYHCAEDADCITPIRDQQTSSNYPSRSEMNTYSNAHANSNLDSAVVGHIRQLLAQGYRIGTEHANERRFQTSSWTSCAPIQTTREADVLSELQSCLQEHNGEYVRLIGIDPKAKRRVSETIIQRPNGKSGGTPIVGKINANGGGGSSPKSPKAGGDGIGQIVGQLMAQGYQLGLEYADERRFKTSSWQSAPAVQARREPDAIAAIESFVNEHANHYVRVVGVDTRLKRRVMETIIHRPGGQVVVAAPQHFASAPSHTSNGSSNANARFGSDTSNQVRQWLAQNYRIGVEYADERRFKTSSWQTGDSINGSRESDVLSAITNFLNQHPNDYVRLIGIDPKLKRRVAETIIQKPGKR